MAEAINGDSSVPEGKRDCRPKGERIIIWNINHSLTGFELPPPVEILLKIIDLYIQDSLRAPAQLGKEFLSPTRPRAITNMFLTLKY